MNKTPDSSETQSRYLTSACINFTMQADVRICSTSNLLLHPYPLPSPDILLPTHEWPQRLWNTHTAICLLVNLEQRQQDAWRSNGCVVQRMHKLYFAILVTITNIHPACLPLVKVRARMRLAIPAFAG